MAYRGPRNQPKMVCVWKDPGPHGVLDTHCGLLGMAMVRGTESGEDSEDTSKAHQEENSSSSFWVQLPLVGYMRTPNAPPL